MSNQDDVQTTDFTVYLQKLTQLDELAKKIQVHFAKEGKTTFWLLKPFWRALISTPFQLGSSSTWVEKILYFIVNPLVIYFVGTMDFLLPLFNGLNPLKEEIPPYLLLIIAAMLYTVAVIKGFFKQVDIFDNTFDLNAFKVLFPVLYEQLRVFKNTEPYSFTALHSHVSTLASGNHEAISNALLSMVQLTNERDELTQRLTGAEELLNKMADELENSKMLFDKSIAAFQAIEHGEVTKDILHVFSDFALFKLEGEKLITVAKHHAYNTPDNIKMDDPDKKDWAVVKVAYAKTPDAYFEIDESHGRVVIANKMKIKGDTFVYSYHLPSRHFDELANRVTEIDSQRLLYNLVLMYNKEKGGS